MKTIGQYPVSRSVLSRNHRAARSLALLRVPSAVCISLLLIAMLFPQPVAGKERSGQEFKYIPKSGDIVFQRSKSPLGPAIEIATASLVTHVGIAMEDHDTMFVYEAVDPVRRIPVSDWIHLGVDDQFCAKRLKNSKDVLTPEILDKIRSEFARFLGRDYDLQFKWSDNELYCSELVYKVFKRAAGIELGKVERFGDFKLDDPTVQFWMKTYIPNGPNLNEKVVSPISVYRDTTLTTVFTTSGWKSYGAERPAGN